ncbi:hypothetical protein BH11PLA2_BH11PLA2_29170 [soil metagenome]
MLFKDRLKAARNSAVISQEELAEKSGVSISTVTKLEQGGRGSRVSLGIASRLARALGVTCEFFADCEDVAAEEPDDATKWAAKATGVSESSIQTADKVLKNGIPDLVKAVESGKMTLAKAAKIAKLPAKDQRKAVADAK